MIKFIGNIGEYFSSNYFDEDFSSKVLAKCGYATEDIKEFNRKITPIKDRFFKFKQLYIEGRLRTKDKIKETHLFHTSLLNALGYDGNSTNYNQLFHLSENEAIPVRHILYRGDQPHLMIMEMQALIKEDEKDPDGLFEQRYNVEEELQSNPAQKYHRSQWEEVFKVPNGIKISPVIINKAISELFLMEQHLRPKYILLLAGNGVFLLEQEKWFRGSYLQFDLEELFTEATANPRANYNALFYFLTSKEALSPDSNMVLLDQLDEDSHKSAYEVTKDLKEGIIHAVEELANEAIWYHYQIKEIQENLDETDDNFEQEVKDDCLRIIYRLLFVFYAESREDLDVLPSNDPIYNRGYSMEMLRDLEQVPLNSETSLNGYFFHESLSKLFYVLSSGYRERDNGHNKSFKVRHIDSPIFDNAKLNHLHKVKFRNKVWQDIICRLSLSKQQKNRARGRISYANLGINQLGSVYESLLAYRGFYAEQDYIEVHKKDKAQEGTYLVPRSRRDDFEEGEILRNSNSGEDVILKKGTFVYRLSGRDRQKSASYYTPEVLTQSTVKYTLKPILERLEKGEMKAIELLDLKLLEPAMGAAAFQNEMINQLAEAYLSYRQKELRDSGRVEWKVEPDKYKEELQKVKAYIATNNTYGVDLNPTAIELGKLSLWLNVIHKDMETPFFSNRICVGNAVVGAWLKVYKVTDLAQELDKNGRPLRKQPKKEWWETAPRQLEFKPQTGYTKIRHGRKPDEIYHFLLPDKNMVPSAGIKMLKEESPAFARGVAQWKNDWINPLNKSELEKLQLLSTKIDDLLTEYYQFQLTIASQTRTRQHIFGATKANEQFQISMRSYDEKERLADQRNRHSAPYFKLKMVMDYWCSLWFWDVRDADQLPNRNQYWDDIASILQLDTSEALEGIRVKRRQQSVYESASQLSLVMDSAGETSELSTTNAADDFMDAVVEYTNRKDLFDNNQRLTLVSQLAKKHFFFHPQLEFLEVFWERGGFDLIAGNPPWLKITFEEKSIFSEKFPEVEIKNLSAPQVRHMQSEFFADEYLSNLFFDELIGTECISTFMNASQNYPLLIGQQTNLYKCILENGFSLLGRNGYMGLLHPEGVYDDPNGQPLRKEIYQRLKYHFHYRNQLKLFAEIGDRVDYGSHIYSGNKNEIGFWSIHYLFHPSTIDGCFIHDGHGECGGMKIKNADSGKYFWNLVSHKNRLVWFGESELKVLSELFDDGEDFSSTKLVTVFSKTLIDVFKRLANNPNKVGDFNSRIIESLHETNDVNNGTIRRETTFPNCSNYEFIFSGPHFSINNPISKTPRSICVEKADYDTVDLTDINENFIQRTNYLLNIPITDWVDRVESVSNTKKWIDSYRVGITKGLSLGAERSLQSYIIFPKANHIYTTISVEFEEEEKVIELTGISSSLIMDFYAKARGKGSITSSPLRLFPMGIPEKIKPYLFLRVLLLNCLNLQYLKLWENNFKKSFKYDKWSITDPRIKTNENLTSDWNHQIPLRNYFERRWAQIEIDILVALSFNLSIDDLVQMYDIQFPVLQQNEDDTWYDTKGNIVFTCSKGLVGIGLDRKEWEQIRNLPAGETYEHTITKSELYNGKVVTYHAPFDKCDRVEDYKLAWAYFEEVFK